MMRTSTGILLGGADLAHLLSPVSPAAASPASASGSSATSSRNSVPPFAAWKKPSLSCVAPGERALAVAEELAFHQVLRDRAAVHREERAVAARALLMDQARRELLAAARFAARCRRAPGCARAFSIICLHLLHRRATRPSSVARRLRLATSRLPAALSGDGELQRRRTRVRSWSSEPAWRRSRTRRPSAPRPRSRRCRAR